jgi:hypothetical protein
VRFLGQVSTVYANHEHQCMVHLFLMTSASFCLFARLTREVSFENPTDIPGHHIQAQHTLTLHPLACHHLISVNPFCGMYPTHLVLQQRVILIILNDRLPSHKLTSIHKSKICEQRTMYSWFTPMNHNPGQCHRVLVHPSRD